MCTFLMHDIAHWNHKKDKVYAYGLTHENILDPEKM